MKPARLVCIAAMLVAATVVLGQNADKNTAGPTKNDYRIRVIEPLEGATITGPSVRVVVNMGTKPEPGAMAERKDVDTMPKPSIQVYLDNQPKGTVNEPDNVVTIDNVTPGSHKIAVVATNRSGEIIDRKEVSFTSTEATSTSASSTYSSSTSSAPSSSYSAPANPPASSYSAPANPPASSYSAPANPPPPSSYSSSSSEETKSQRTLPKTGSPAPLLAAAGLGLLALGLAARPKV